MNPGLNLELHAKKKCELLPQTGRPKVGEGSGKIQPRKLEAAYHWSVMVDPTTETARYPNRKARMHSRLDPRAASASFARQIAG